MTVRLEYVPAEADAVVTELRVYADPARTGTPVATAIPTQTGGVWTVDVTLPDGDFYSAFDVTDSTGSYADGNDFFLVLDGQVERSIVSLAVVLRHLFANNNGGSFDIDYHRDRDGAEVTDLLLSATRPIEEKAGAVLVRTVTQAISGRSAVLQSPVVAAAVSDANGVALTGFVLDAPAGLLTSVPFGATTVTYTVGRNPIPHNIRKATLTWIAYWWRREHGGSENYQQPDGIGVAGGVMGVTALDRQIDAILGPDRRGMRVS